MLVSLFTLVLGLVIGYFATQNTTPVALQFGDYILAEIPLYVVAVGSMLLGLFIAWIFYFARTVSSALTIYGKDSAMKKAKQTIAELEQRVRELEAEDHQLKNDRKAVNAWSSEQSTKPGHDHRTQSSMSGLKIPFLSRNLRA
jgi:uncharacterized integral membrane protein